MRKEELKLGFEDESIKDFLHKVASKPCTPAGGSIAALCAASSAALTEMVAARTSNKIENEDVIIEMKEILQKCSVYRDEFLQDMDRDSEAYKDVMYALQLSEADEKEKEKKQVEVQRSYKEAVNIPREIARRIIRMIDIIKVVIEKGNKNIKTDAIEAHLMAKASALSLLYHIKINLASITDAGFVDTVLAEVEIMKDQIEQNNEVEYQLGL
ncbi:MAG: cyclodeaminase/cyclohydrolase family protein [Clostridia bacterium]